MAQRPHRRAHRRNRRAPLALGFGVSSGAGAEAGIITAIIAGIIAAVFGGSHIQVSGPTGAMVVVIAPIIATYGTRALPWSRFSPGSSS